MACERLPLLLVVMGRGVKHPDLELVVRTTCDEPPVACRAGARVRAGDAAGREGRCPGDRVDAEAVGGNDDVIDGGLVLELEDGDVAVGRGACEQTAGLMRRPGDDVDRGLVQREVVDALPLGRLLVALLLPNEDLAVIACGGEDVAVLGMGPCYAPDGTFMAVQTV
jgi:hypothetical protein